MDNCLLVTLDGIRIDVAGVPTKSFVEKLDGPLNGIVFALASIVRDISDGHMNQEFNWTHNPEGLRLRPSGTGRLFARWSFEPSPSLQAIPRSHVNLAIDRLLKLGEGRDSAWSESVLEYLYEVSGSLPDGVFLFLGDSKNPKRFTVLDPDDGLELQEEFSAKLQASVEAVAGGQTTHAVEEVAQRQRLSW